MNMHMSAPCKITHTHTFESLHVSQGNPCAPTHTLWGNWMSVISRFKRNWISFRPNALKLIRNGKRKWTTYRSVSMWEEACFCGSWHANEIYIKGGSFDINVIYNILYYEIVWPCDTSLLLCDSSYFVFLCFSVCVCMYVSSGGVTVQQGCVYGRVVAGRTGTTGQGSRIGL